MRIATRSFKRTDWYVTSPFGWRKDPFTGENKFHRGCDYGTHVKKWPQYGLEKGTVLSAGRDSSKAIFAWVRYPRLGIDLLHYHLDSVLVKKGQEIDENTIVGYTGKTGKATGIHWHMGLRKSGSTTYIDPHAYEYKEYVKPVPTPTPVPTPAPAGFKKGEKVVPTKLISYTGVRLVQWDKQYTVYQDSRNDRVVLAAPRNGKLVVWAAMNIKNVRRI